jgi:hypothetical protein
MQQINVSNLLQSMAEKWPSAWVARTEVERFSGGLIGEKYLANLDSAGKGPKGRFRSGRKVCYPVASLISWLEARSEAIPSKRS